MKKPEPSSAIRDEARSIHPRLIAERLPFTKMPPIAGSGVYAFFLRTGSSLPIVSAGDDGLLYVGQASELRDRSHFDDSSSSGSTLRRTLGALLRDQLSLVPFPGRKNPGDRRSQYRFHPESEAALSKWMIANLIATKVGTSNYDGVETCLIAAMKPPLNLQKWPRATPNPQRKEIKAARKRCADEAQKLFGHSI